MRRVLGVTLIEVLVSLIILSIMLLGVDAMQLSGLREAKIALYYAEATQQLRLIQEKLSISQEANAQEAIAAWNVQNAEVLPQGRGTVKQGVVNVFWGEAATSCPVNHIGLSGCVTSAFNQEGLF